MLLLAPLAAMAQWAEPAKFTVTHKAVGDKEIVITFKGTIEQGWHVYSTDVGEGGPTPATFNIDEAKGLKPIGKLRALTKAKRSYDEIFGRELSFHEGTCIFEQRMAITAPEYSLKGYLEYGACNDHSCTPPTAVDVDFKGSVESGNHTPPALQATPSILEGEEKAPQLPKGEEPPYPLKGRKSSKFKVQSSNNYDSLLWASRVTEIKALSADYGASPANEDGGYSLLWLFLMGLVGGLIAVVTPCVWPVIPMTVSFFLKRNGAPQPPKGEEKGYRLEVSGYRSHVRKPKSEPQACQSNLSRRRVSQISNNKGIKLHAGETIDLSSADTMQLKKIPGIGSYYAGKIVRYRSRLGGFVSLSQLKEISGLPEDIAAWVTLDNTPVTQLHINQLTFGELLKHPYLNFEQVRAIIDHRRHYGPVSSFSDLQTYPAFSAADFERLKPYIAFD